MHLRKQSQLWTATSLYLLVLAVPAVAEVMDKEPTIREVWTSAIIYLVLALVLGRLHPALGLVLLVIPSTAFGMLTEIWEPSMGRAIREEAGMTYIVQTYAANGLILIGYTAGLCLWIRSRKRKKSCTVA